MLPPSAPDLTDGNGRQASGREAHSHKITVYLSEDEFLDLERARLALRARGVSLDRGRLVREAIAVVLADLEAGAHNSVIVRRLRGPAAGGVPPAAGGVPPQAPAGTQ